MTRLNVGDLSDGTNRAPARRRLRLGLDSGAAVGTEFTKARLHKGGNMTITAARRAPGTQHTAVRCVDADVHPVPRRGQLLEFIPEPWRSRYFTSHPVGEQIYYDPPDYAHCAAMCGSPEIVEGFLCRFRLGLGFPDLVVDGR